MAQVATALRVKLVQLVRLFPQQELAQQAATVRTVQQRFRQDRLRLLARMERTERQAQLVQMAPLVWPEVTQLGK